MEQGGTERNKKEPERGIGTKWKGIGKSKMERKGDEQKGTKGNATQRRVWVGRERDGTEQTETDGNRTGNRWERKEKNRERREMGKKRKWKE